MKQKALLVAMLGMCSLCAPLRAQETVNLTNGEYPPYHSEFSPHYGLWSHIVSEAFALEGLSVKYGFFPWKRAMEMAKYGDEWQGSAVWGYSDERAEFFRYSEVIATQSIVFYHLKSFPFHWESIEALRGLQIGTTNGYSYGTAFDEAAKLKLITVESATRDEQNLKKLLNNRIQVFPNDLIVCAEQMRKTLNSAEQAEIGYDPKPLTTMAVHLLISKQAKNGSDLLERFNKGLRKLKASGKYEQMIADAIAGKYSVQRERWKP